MLAGFLGGAIRRSAHSGPHCNAEINFRFTLTERRTLARQKAALQVQTAFANKSTDDFTPQLGAHFRVTMKTLARRYAVSPLGSHSFRFFREFRCPGCLGQKAYRSRYRGILEQVFLFFCCSSPSAVNVVSIAPTSFEPSPCWNPERLWAGSTINPPVTQVPAPALHNAPSRVYTGVS